MAKAHDHEIVRSLVTHLKAVSCTKNNDFVWSQNPVEHEAISIACHVGLDIGMSDHSNFLDPIGPQALV